jgi:hypothetical protein
MKSEATFGLPMRVLALMLGVVLVCATFLASGGAVQAQASQKSKIVVPVTGELEDGGKFKGKIVNPEVFAKKNGKLAMSGTLKGRAIPKDGEAQRVSQEFTTPVKVKETGDTFTFAQQRECPILNLDLGPLNLDLLGLVVDLSPINLDVTAVPGAGNLLGNLLCAVAGLLDGFDLGGIISDVIADLLNSILEGLFGDLFG